MTEGKQPQMNTDERGWRYEELGVVQEGEPISAHGHDLWKHEWIRLPVSRASLPHPQHRHQFHEMDHYAIVVDGKTIAFAARELSMNVWGFYRAIPVNQD